MSPRPPLISAPPHEVSAEVHRPRVIHFIQADGQPTWAQSFRWYLLESYFSVLLVFVPLCVAAHHLNWDAALRFSFSLLAIMPLAKLLGDSTQQLSFSGLGQMLAGLCNTFGNPVRVTIGVVSLLQGQIRIVQTSMLGSILSNILLVLGCSFVAVGFKNSESRFKIIATQTSSSIMTLSCITLVIPATYHSTLEDKSNQESLLIISRGIAVVFLPIYCVYIYFQPQSRAYLFVPKRVNKCYCGCNCPCSKADLQAVSHVDGSLASGSDFIYSTVTLEVDVPANLWQMNHAWGILDVENANMSVAAAVTTLLLVILMTLFCVDYLVASIEEFAESYHVSKAFIGLILLPIVANTAEIVTSVRMAKKDQMELSIGICVGSSVQITLLVVPLLVVVGWMYAFLSGFDLINFVQSGHEFTLFFTRLETVILVASVLLAKTLIQNGKMHYMNGFVLLTVYSIISLACWVS